MASKPVDFCSEKIVQTWVAFTERFVELISVLVRRRLPRRRKRVEIGDNGFNLSGLENELRHVGMARHNAFRQRFGEIVRRIARNHYAERRRLGVKARVTFADGVAAGAVGLDYSAPLRNGTAVILTLCRGGKKRCG